MLVLLTLEETSLARQLVVGSGVPLGHALWPRLQKYADLIAQNADKDLHIELKPVPYLRLAEVLERGELDGDLGRLKEVYENVPSIVRVPEPIAILRLFFIFNKERILKDLDGIRQYKTAADLGNVFQKRACQELKLNCEFIGLGSSSMDMLRLMRVGTVITTQFHAEQHFSQTNEPQLFSLGEKSYYQEPVYFFITKKNEDLAEKLNAAIKKVKSSDAFKQIMGGEP